MVVAGGDVGNERTEGVEWSLVTVVELSLHILLNLLQRHMTRTLDKCLYVFVPGTCYEFTHRVEFGKLSRIIGVGNTAGAQSVAKRECNIVFSHDVADVVEMLIQETLPILQQAPFTHDAASTTHDAAKTAVGKMHVVPAYSGMDGEIVHALFALLDKRVAIHLPREVFHLAVYLLQCLIDRHCAHRNRTVAQYPFTCFVDVVSRRKVHQRVASPFARPYRLVHLFLDARSSGRVADVGVNFHEEIPADNHRLTLRMIPVGRQHGTSACNLVAHELRCDMSLDAQFLTVHVLADSHIFHLWGDDSRLSVSHLRYAALTLRTVLNPRQAQLRQSAVEIHLIVRVSIRSAGVVDIYRGIWSHVGNTVLILRNGRSEVHLCHSDSYLRKNLSRHVSLFSLCVCFIVVWHYIICYMFIPI